MFQKRISPNVKNQKLKASLTLLQNSAPSICPLNCSAPFFCKLTIRTKAPGWRAKGSMGSESESWETAVLLVVAFGAQKWTKNGFTFGKDRVFWDIFPKDVWSDNWSENAGSKLLTNNTFEIVKCRYNTKTESTETNPSNPIKNWGKTIQHRSLGVVLTVFALRSWSVGVIVKRHLLLHGEKPTKFKNQRSSVYFSWFPSKKSQNFDEHTFHVFFGVDKFLGKFYRLMAESLAVFTSALCLISSIASAAGSSSAMAFRRWTLVDVIHASWVFFNVGENPKMFGSHYNKTSQWMYSNSWKTQVSHYNRKFIVGNDPTIENKGSQSPNKLSMFVSNHFFSIIPFDVDGLVLGPLIFLGNHFKKNAKGMKLKKIFAENNSCF